MDPNEATPEFTFKMFGTSSQQKQFLEAFEGFEEEWEAQGHQSLSAQAANQRLLGRLTVPQEWQTGGPINFVFGPPHFLQFIEFLKEPATTATIEVFIGGILHAVLSRYHKIFEEHDHEGKNASYPVILCTSAWLMHEGVLVTIAADIQSSMDYKLAELLTPDGFRRAGLWLQQHGVTHTYLTYYIRNGNIDAIPTLSMYPLEELLRNPNASLPPRH